MEGWEGRMKEEAKEERKKSSEEKEKRKNKTEMWRGVRQRVNEVKGKKNEKRRRVYEKICFR